MFNHTRARAGSVYVVSYPKSGNTWVRFLLSNLIKRPRDVIDFHTVHEYIPEVGSHTYVCSPVNRPRIFKTHSLYKRDLARAIYVIRDGRDVYVSYYHFLKGKLEAGTSFGQFLRSPDLWPCRWGEHAGSWLGRRSRRRALLLVRYEDLLSDCRSQLRAMADFAGLDAGTPEIDAAVSAASFDNMRHLEVERGRAFQKQDQVDLFTRKGVVGDWRNYFGPEESAYFKRREGTWLTQLGYEPDGRW